MNDSEHSFVTADGLWEVHVKGCIVTIAYQGIFWDTCQWNGISGAMYSDRATWESVDGDFKSSVADMPPEIWHEIERRISELDKPRLYDTLWNDGRGTPPTRIFQRAHNVKPYQPGDLVMDVCCIHVEPLSELDEIKREVATLKRIMNDT